MHRLLLGHVLNPRLQHFMQSKPAEAAAAHATALAATASTSSAAAVASANPTLPNAA